MKKLIGILLALVLVAGGLADFAYVQAAPDNGFSEVSAAFVTGWTYTAPGDTFSNHEVTGNKAWASRLSPLQPSGPAIDATLSLDSDLAFDWVTPAPETMGPPLYEWSFTNPEEGTFFWWAGVGFDEAAVTFFPGFDCSRSADQTVFSESGIQTLTIKVTPREEGMSTFMVNIIAEEDDYVIPVITYEGTEFPGMPGVFITENDAVVDTEYTYTVTIEVTLKDGISEVEFMPQVGVDIPTKVSTLGTETGSSVSWTMPEVGTWKWSAAEGTYVWHWKEGIARSVTFPGYSRGIVNIPPVAQASVSPYLAPVGSVFTFDGGASYDSDGTIVSYDWDFGDGVTGFGKTTTHAYTSAGIYIVTLTVTDDSGATDTDTATVTVTKPVDLFMHGAAPDLGLDATAPSSTTAKYKDSPSINRTTFREIGTWNAAPMGKVQALVSLGNLTTWVGLRNSDDQGTYFDVRAEVLKNGVVIASGEVKGIKGVTRNPDKATQVVIAFGTIPDTTFQVGDVFSIRVLAKVADMGGHSSAVGLRLYYDSVSRPSCVNTMLRD